MGEDANGDDQTSKHSNFSHQHFTPDIADKSTSLSIDGPAGLLNAAFTPPYASPQLICFFGLVKQAMVDEPNDMWAAAMVIYQTIISADAKGLKDHGDWMFGPTALQYDQIVQLPSKQEQDSAVRKAIQQEQQL